jgi:para-nitrobenzyl esterase
VTEGEHTTVGTEPEHLTVTTRSGRVQGTWSNGVAAFKGMPYAAAPTGRLRWRAPRPPEPWDGIRAADAFGPIAPQPITEISGPQPLEMSEDCLSVNVYTPDLGGRLPVMVWIHGGAYYVGSSADPMFDGTLLASLGVVVVTFNYRLGALGYLDLSSLSQGDDEFESNVALRDQLAALLWVQENIEAFGGDRDRVTVFGESAGGGAVAALMASPASDGLFHAAIAESAPIGSVYGPETNARFAEQFLRALDVEPGDASRLRELPVTLLTDACADFVETNPITSPGTIPVAPAMDGDVLPDYPLNAFANGTAVRVPLVIGTNKNEAALFKLMRSPILPTTVRSIDLMMQNLGIDKALEIPQGYVGYPSRRAALHVSTDAAFRMPTIWAASGHSGYAPTWVYEFDYAQPVLKLTGLGAMHGAELPFVWGNPPPAPVPLGGAHAAAALGERIRARWVSFAENHDPNLPGLEPHWPHYESGDRYTMVFDREDHVVRDLQSAERALWGDEFIGFH